MSSLLERITKVKEEINSLKNETHIKETNLKFLENLRVHCPHEFSKPLENYEHEGGTCIKCGINELYAHTLKMLNAN